jgi:hypothetical protein
MKHDHTNQLGAGQSAKAIACQKEQRSATSIDADCSGTNHAPPVPSLDAPLQVAAQVKKSRAHTGINKRALDPAAERQHGKHTRACAPHERGPFHGNALSSRTRRTLSDVARRWKELRLQESIYASAHMTTQAAFQLTRTRWRYAGQDISLSCVCAHRKTRPNFSWPSGPNDTTAEKVVAAAPAAAPAASPSASAAHNKVGIRNQALSRNIEATRTSKASQQTAAAPSVCTHPPHWPGE